MAASTPIRHRLFLTLVATGLVGSLAEASGHTGHSRPHSSPCV
jgi:hypothetical protein